MERIHKKGSIDWRSSLVYICVRTPHIISWSFGRKTRPSLCGQKTRSVPNKKFKQTAVSSGEFSARFTDMGPGHHVSVPDCWLLDTRRGTGLENLTRSAAQGPPAHKYEQYATPGIRYTAADYGINLYRLKLGNDYTILFNNNRYLFALPIGFARDFNTVFFSYKTFYMP